MIPARYFPVSAKMFKTFRGPLDLAQDAESCSEIAPAETAVRPPVELHPGDWDRITAFAPKTTEEVERRRVFGGEVTHAATLRYEFRDVLATPHGFFTVRAAHAQSRATDLGALLRTPIETRPQGFYATTSVSQMYFGHWLHDALPTARLARPEEALFLPTPKAWGHAHAYIEALGIDRVAADYVHFERMSVALDLGQNSNLAARRRAVHADVQGRLDQSDAKGLYISRGRSGAARVLVNEDALIDALKARGFAVVSTSDPLSTIWERAARVAQVVTIQGSHWAHALYTARADASYVSIVPADHFGTAFLTYLPSLGAVPGVVVAEQASGGYRVDVDAVLGMLERLSDRRGRAVS